eukprot:COSAG01_NODE_60481_length_294_cov_1.317949_1_plen_65_part_10
MAWGRYLNAFLGQELLCKYGTCEASSDDGKTMRMEQVMVFHCVRPAAAAALNRMRDLIVNPPDTP